MPTHSEKRRLPYAAEQMYDLVADVESYPDFLPWTAAARIISRCTTETGEVMEAELVISFKLFREKFGSRVTLFPDEGRIDTEYIDGPFRHMHARWQFRNLEAGGCEVAFSVDFEFRNRMLQRLIGVVFNEAMQRIVGAFERRAAQLYGPSSGAR